MAVNPHAQIHPLAALALQRSIAAIPLLHSAGAVRSKTDYANLPKPSTQKSPLVAPVESLQVIAKELLPYEIKRRPNSGWLPVYSAYRNGRSRKITLVRDVRGSMDHFVRDLSKLVPEDRMKIKSAGTKLEIVGDYTGPIRDWLRARSF
ncbi:hypothetical protein BASA83_009838 [Batrachochytrium salamandrivorans]|nr:hypothetical protein BASA81_017086 [Batrachochytrium salamandrivorans]KAH9267624.1 hypothetical protein BASA83_009838 [Batrachochytrium salamandrivorans]